MTSNNYAQVVADLRQSFESGVLSSIDQRLNQLQQIDLLIQENKAEIEDAVYKDLRKSQFEVILCETICTLKEVRIALNNLREWTKPERVAGGLLNVTNTLEVHKDPLGVILVMGAWNYPICLVLQPIIGAIAAGNCCVVKPSEVASHSAELLGRIIPKYLSSECCRVINGGIPETTELLRCRFDHILYTGNPAVAKIVMRAAAEHLTPVTLELGGKNPTIVDSTCDFDLVGQRIAWGKFLNNGQTCIGVDYVMCLDNCQDQLIESIKKAVVKFFGEDPQTSNSYGRIINKRHFKRISDMIDEDKVVFGNTKKEEDLYISPTILANVEDTDRIMQDEIFGPVMAVSNVPSLQHAIKLIRQREKPLAVYVFSKDKELVETVKNTTSSGQFVVNDTLMQFGAPLPFGGVGNSGMGSYHDKYSVDALSHKKAVMYCPQQGEALLAMIRYPPYDAPGKPKMLQRFKWFSVPGVKKGLGFGTMFFMFLFILCCALLFPVLSERFAV